MPLAPLLLLLLLLLLSLHRSTEADAQPLHQTIYVDDTTSSGSARSGSTMIVGMCPAAPLCTHSAPSWVDYLSYCVLPSSTSLLSMRSSRHTSYLESPRWRQWLLSTLHELLVEVQGQPHVIAAVLDAVTWKVNHRDERLVLYAVGDHGVGKSFTARLISLAWSLHCAKGFETSCSSASRGGRGGESGNKLGGGVCSCERGDAVLAISGTAYVGMAPPARIQARLTEAICHHARQYPHGMVLLDDVSAMPEEALQFLAPLFGQAMGRRSSSSPLSSPAAAAASSPPTPGSTPSPGDDEVSSVFQECSDVDLRKLLVFVTSDLGTQERTRRLSSTTEIAALIPAAYRLRPTRLSPLPCRAADDSSTDLESPNCRMSSDGNTASGRGDHRRRDEGTFDDNDCNDGDGRVVVLPFQALTLDTARAIVMDTVTSLPCREPRVLSATITAEAVAHVVSQATTFGSFNAENGHALKRTISEGIDYVIAVAMRPVAVDEVISHLRVVLKQKEKRMTTVTTDEDEVEDEVVELGAELLAVGHL